MANLKEKLIKTVNKLRWTLEVEPKAVRNVKKAIKAAQKESQNLKTEKGEFSHH